MSFKNNAKKTHIVIGLSDKLYKQNTLALAINWVWQTWIIVDEGILVTRGQSFMNFICLLGFNLIFQIHQIHRVSVSRMNGICSKCYFIVML